jgi:hypothetical protein
LSAGLVICAWVQSEGASRGGVDMQRGKRYGGIARFIRSDDDGGAEALCSDCEMEAK